MTDDAQRNEIPPADGADDQSIASSERVKAFADAVVAIAMTLLSLPLVDSVSQAAADNFTTLQWLQANLSSILVFLISFVVIANFWIIHHRLFARVERVTGALLWITVAWMLTIVWLPVTTALTGQMNSDTPQRVLYIGSMVLASLLLLATRLYVRRHPRLHDIDSVRLTRGLVADIVMTLLFLLSLGVAVLFPGIGYSALFLMLLTSPLHGMSMRLVSRRSRRRGEAQ